MTYQLVLVGYATCCKAFRSCIVFARRYTSFPSLATLFASCSGMRCVHVSAMLQLSHFIVESAVDGVVQDTSEAGMLRSWA